jgi:hypothetical protein
MKKTFYIFTLLLLTTIASASAQKGFYLGVAGNFSTSYIMNQNIYGLVALKEEVITSGLGANLSIGYDFPTTIGLKTEVGFGTIGQKYKPKNQGDTTTIDRRIKLNYLNVPLLLKIRAGGKIAQFYLLVGPQFSFLMSANQDYTIGGKPYPDIDVRINNNDTITNIVVDRAKKDVKDRYSSMDIFARLDLGADIYLIPKLFLNVGVSFNYGLTDINASDWRLNDVDGNYNASHNVYGKLNIGINYRF